MQTAQLIAADIFCTHYHAEFSFIHTLHENGVIELVTEDRGIFIREDDLQKLEKITRLHYDLHINAEGIETVIHLLSRLENMQREISQLKNRLGIYEY